MTADVVGLYPNIPHEQGIEALRESLEKRDKKTIPTEKLIEMTEFVLKNNLFEFNGETYQQISGTAIGTKFAPPYACIFMDKVEREIIDAQELKPWLWLRYIDDVFFIWTHGAESLHNFMDALNQAHDTIKFTFEISQEDMPRDYVGPKHLKLLPHPGINFLDLRLTLDKGKILNDLYCKPTDCHQYLSFTSCHPPHVKRSIVYSQAMRVHRLCSLEIDVQKNIRNLTQWFIKRGYPPDMVEEQIRKAKSTMSGHPVGTPQARNKDITPLVLTYHPRLQKVNNIIRKHFHILQADNSTQRVFPRAPFVSFRNPKTLRRSLVRAKVPQGDITKGTFQCGAPRCQTCSNLKVTDTFSRRHDGKQYKINFSFNCNSKGLIYLFNCKVCTKQLVGVCTTKWRERWNNYKDNSRKALNKAPHMQPELHSHFELPGHTSLTTDIEVTLIDKTDLREPKVREKFWMSELRTLVPEGLNVSESN